MPTPIKQNETKPLLAPDTYPARCVEVIELGTQQVTFEGNEKSVVQVQLVFEIPSEQYTGGDMEGHPVRTFSTYTMSTHPKAKLGQALVAWRGREFSDEEKAAFTLDKVLGVPCNLTINDKGYVKAITKLTKGLAIADAHYPLRYFSLNKDDFKKPENLQFLSEMHEKLQEKIRQSPEYQALMGKDLPAPPADTPAHDDDLPF